jgi:hypothetical protein
MSANLLTNLSISHGDGSEIAMHLTRSDGVSLSVSLGHQDFGRFIDDLVRAGTKAGATRLAAQRAETDAWPSVFSTAKVLNIAIADSDDRKRTHLVLRLQGLDLTFQVTPTIVQTLADLFSQAAKAIAADVSRPQ